MRNQGERPAHEHGLEAALHAAGAPVPEQAAVHGVVELSAATRTPWQAGIGVIAPYDFALDRELWRWAPDDVSLHVTRLPYVHVPVTVDQAAALSKGKSVTRAVRALLAPEPLAVGYACASGSFVHGAAGERELHRTMLAAGAPAAVTTSGALIRALETLGTDRIAVVTPYVDSVTDRLLAYLAEHDVAVTSSVGLGLLSHIWKVTYAEVARAVHEADHPDAQAVYISCTNVLTYDIIAPLERELGKPVIAANQVTMWGLLRAAGRRAVAHGQSLIDVAAPSAA
ncbi:MAG: Asp/Glu racemase [Nocardiopsis sp. BM-2018]|uniref:Maleate isomerase n=1 Tax=Nocardiopsis metallicus TaxID=179819 RepID=A0A840WD29_9ACTN|nr:Asp/Glu racemase [Nocardiopsis metallicus]MBB5494072.1 maleate isomerase [Nocardiopsis metallicus]QRN81285.1 MAG: Asp/Glu racemase [Nocardiopsis sp. BM-2018]